MSITAQMVKELRVKSSAGMMDCKKALSETNGDMEAAIDWLRKKGLSSASKKSGRIASEGLVGIKINNQEASIVEVNSETDFVARNIEFQNFVKDICFLSLQLWTQFVCCTSCCLEACFQTRFFLSFASFQIRVKV